MTSPLLIEQLDSAIDVIVANPAAAQPYVDERIRKLVGLARELMSLPRVEFKARLRADLEQQASAIAAKSQSLTSDPKSRQMRPRPGEPEAILPTLFGGGYGNYPVHGTNFAASFLLHAAALALIISSGFWIAKYERPLPREHVVAVLTEPSPYLLPAAPDQAGGGGGGGDRDKLQASKGTSPRFAREQIAPPAIVIRNAQPKLPAEATVVGPPQLTFPQTGSTGDPLSAVLAPPSNGVGSGGGIGNGWGGGVGSGSGPGLGPGHGGGFGGGIYRVGGGVSAPRAIYDPDPEYSDEARKAKYQGTVILWAIISTDGRVRDVKIARSLGMGLDEKAIDAVRKWRFEPSMKDGHPVAVQVNIEISFRLY